MIVMAVYVALVAVSEVVVFFVGIELDRVVPDGWNLIVAMVLFFGVIWLMWPISVYVTEKYLARAESAGALPAE